MQSRSYINGFALLEALLAWSILMIALLGMLALQIENLRKIRHGYFYSIAWVQLQSMAERLRVNADAVARMREKQIWNLQNKVILPNSEGDFHCRQQMCTIILQRHESSTQTITETIVL
jgi:type IV pilus assembly protein PilV